MERYGLNLPDFARGETFADKPHPAFEPLFGGHNQSTELSSQSSDKGHSGLNEQLSAMVGFEDIENGPIEQVGDHEEDRIPLSEHQQVLDELAKHHADEIDELTQKFQQEVLRHLEDIQSRFADVVAKRIEPELAGTLSSLFQERLTATCIGKLAAEVRTVVQKSTIDCLKISGPPELAAAIIGNLPSENFPIEVAESDCIDLMVSFNDKCISTNINDWMRHLEKALES